MVNDLDYIKLSFSELPHFTTSDSWINYKFNEADTSWMIFALEERVGQEPKWRCIHSSYWGSNHCMYGIYKKGAAWEAHIGQRLVRGKKVAVEKYLDFRKLSTTQISGLGVFLPVSSKAICESNPSALDSYHGHQWDKSDWVCDGSDPMGPFRIPLSSRANLAFVTEVDGPCEIFLETPQGDVAVLPSATMDLFTNGGV